LGQRAKQILFYYSDSLECIYEINLGNQSHNIWIEGQSIFTYDSKNQKIINSNGFQNNIEGFLRGASILEKYNLIGSSELIIERQDRINASGKIFIFNKNWELIKKLKINNEGQILEIRCPGYEDKNYNSFLGNKIKTNFENFNINKNFIFESILEKSNFITEKNTYDFKDLLNHLNQNSYLITKYSKKQVYNINDFYQFEGKLFLKALFNYVFKREYSINELILYSEMLENGTISKIELINIFLKNESAKDVKIKK
jgi:hypothetical protein